MTANCFRLYHMVEAGPALLSGARAQNAAMDQSPDKLDGIERLQIHMLEPKEITPLEVENQIMAILASQPEKFSQRIDPQSTQGDNILPNFQIYHGIFSERSREDECVYSSAAR